MILSKSTMINLRYLSIFNVILIGISGCQTNLDTYSAKQSAQPQVFESIRAMPINHSQSSLDCVGLYHCEINKISKMTILDTSTHSPVWSKKTAKLPVEIETFGDGIGDASKQYPTYRVKFPSGQHLVTMRYYMDDTYNNFETFNFMHKFEGGSSYQLKAYRQIQKTGYSLLAQSAPTPLCIDLYQDAKLTKRWCKQPNQKGALTNELIQMTL